MLQTLSLLPLFYNQELVIDHLLPIYWPSKQDHGFKDVNIKVLMYIYNTYVKRYALIFFIDLSKNTTRTNNSAEGSNSGLSPYRNQRMTLEKFASYCEVYWKRELFKKPAAVISPFTVDTFLVDIQKVSRYNIEDLLNWLFNGPEIETLAIKPIARPLKWFTRHTLVKDKKYVQWKQEGLKNIAE